MTVLVVAAHPDDEILGCGGTIARESRRGEKVHILILGEGATSRAADQSAVSRLQNAARNAASTVGAEAPRFLGLPDNRLDTVPLLEVVQAIEAVIDDVAPTQVYVQHGGDLNVDHASTYRAVLTATRPLPGGNIAGVYAFPVPSSTEWAFGSFTPRFTPQRFVDISATLDRKVNALNCYSDEVRPAPHPRSIDAVTASAVHYGAMVGVAAAEPFSVVWEVC